MMCYYLLRNNTESGPYTLKELKAMPLLTSDLIWINGESTSWKSPLEIEDLQGLAKNPEQAKKEVTLAAKPTASTNNTTLQQPSQASPPTGEPLPKPSFEELRKKYENNGSRKKILKHHVSIGANLMGILILVIGISLSAFMIQKAVENIEQDTVVATAEAREIGEATMYISASSQAAMAPETVEASNSRTTTAIASETKKEIFQETVEEPMNTDAALTVPATKKEPPVSKKEMKKKTAEAEPEQQPAAEKEEAKETAEKDTTATKKRLEKEPAEEKENEKSSPKLRLTANEYKVGLLGGISNLELSVTNPSQQSIIRAVVVVEYLKPNGKVVGSQKIEISDLAPNAAKKVPVPDNSRGISVRYRVVNVESR